MKVTSMNLPEKLLEKIQDIAKKKNVSQSRVVSDLLALGLQKQNVLDTAHELEATALKNDIVNELKSELNDAKNSLTLDTKYTVEKLQNRLDEISNAVSNLKKFKILWQETLFAVLFTKKLSANAAAQVRLTQQRIDEIKQETREELEQFLHTLT